MVKEEKFIVLMEKGTTEKEAKDFIEKLHDIGGCLRNPMLTMTDGTMAFPIAIPKENAKTVKSIPKVWRVEREAYFHPSTD